MVQTSTFPSGSDVRHNLVRLHRVVTTARWVVHDPLKVLWALVGLALSFTLLGVGSTFAFVDRRHAPDFPGWLHPALEPALRVHGGVLLLLAALNIWALASICQAYNRRAWTIHRWAALLTAFYAVLCTALQVMWEPFTPMTFWYGFSAVLSLLLLVLAPPFESHDLHNADLTTDTRNCA